MMESFIAKEAAEKVTEKPQTLVEKFWDNLEKTVDVEPSEKAIQETKIADWWEGLEKNINGSEIIEKKGGSYADVKKDSDGAISEVHHMPADSTTKLEYGDGPAIKMDKEDHRQTASCGNSIEAQEYRQEQRELIEQGKFREAIQMDIDDIHDKFGDKYDEGIAEMNEYVKKLEEEGRV